MSKLEKFYYPESIQEALQILNDESKKNAVIAGGSSLSLTRDDSIDGLVDITRLGLDYIKPEDGGLKIGAATVIQDLFKSEHTEKFAGGIISKAASVIASRPLRNVITLGGNIVQLRVWSDMPPVLLALDAIIRTRGAQNREFRAREFFEKHPKKILEKGEIVTEIEFPMPGEKSGAEFIKFSKTVGDYAIASVACYMEFEGKVCTNARIAVGAAGIMPVRCEKIEEFLKDRELNEELIAEAAALCSDCVKPVSNVWGSAEYKLELVQVLIERGLKGCMNKVQV